MSLSANWQLPLLPLTNHKAATRWVTFQLTTSRLSYISGRCSSRALFAVCTSSTLHPVHLICRCSEFCSLFASVRFWHGLRATIAIGAFLET